MEPSVDKSSPKALVVCPDYPEIAKSLEAAYQVKTASNGVQLVRQAVAFVPQVVVSQVDLPGLNALNATKVLNLVGVEVPVVFLASTQDEQLVERLHQLTNCIGVLDPHIQPGPLLEALTTKLETWKPMHAPVEYSFRQHEWTDLMSASGRKRILVIEDSDPARRLNLLVLDQHREYELYSAQDGLEGLYKALMLKPNLIVTDVRLPVLDGIALTQLLYVLGHPFPVVYLTNHHQTTMQRARRLEGVMGVVDKAMVAHRDKFYREIKTYLGTGEQLMAQTKKLYAEGNVESLKQKGVDLNQWAAPKNLAATG